MAGKMVSWDIDELLSQSRLIKTYLTNIKQELDEEKSVKELVEESFQSPAGELYRQHLTGNIHSLFQIVEEVESLMKDLDNVISDCYRNCENDVSQKVQYLISSLQ